MGIDFGLSQKLKNENQAFLMKIDNGSFTLRMLSKRVLASNQLFLAYSLLRDNDEQDDRKWHG